MPQYTQDPEGKSVELLNLPEWEIKNSKEVKTSDDLSEYRNYATTRLLESGQKPEDFNEGLNQTLFKSGLEKGIFQAPDQNLPEEEQNRVLNDNFLGFANSKSVDPLKDFELVANNLRSTDPESAARIESVYTKALDQKTKGIQEPGFETEFEDVKNNFITPDRVQAARIQYAKDNKLSFIDYPVAPAEGSSNADRRDVWINPDASLDRTSVYNSVDRAKGIVDPSTTALAEDWLKTDEGKTIPRWQQRENQTIQNLISVKYQESLQADPSGPQANFGQMMNNASEINNEVVAQTGKTEAATATNLKEEPSLFDKALGVFVPTQQRDTGKRAEWSIGQAYTALKQSDPQNPLVTSYTKDQFVNAATDFIKQRTSKPIDIEKPENNFIELSDGTKVPLSNTALLPTDKFEQGMEAAGLSDRDKDVATAIRKSYQAANTKELNKALMDYDGENYHNFYVDNVDKYDSKTELISAYIDEKSKDSNWSSFWKPRTMGVIRSIPNSVNAVVQAVGGGVSDLIGAEGARDFFTKWAVQDAEQEQTRQTYATAMGAPLGIGYTIASNAAPLLADLLITKGATSAVKAATKPLIKTAANLFKESGVEFIKGSLSNETKGLVGNYVKGFALAGAETSPSQIFRAIRKDIESNLIPVITATTAQRLTGFTRSAQQQYVSTYMDMKSQKNVDGTDKFTEEEIRTNSMYGAINAGASTAIIEHSFGRIFGEGADQLLTGQANLRQLKYYTNQLSKAVKGSGIGGDELYNTLKGVTKEIIAAQYKDIIKEIPAEFFEEATDQFTQNVIGSLVNNKDLSVSDAFEGVLESGIVGGFYGGAIGGVTQSGLLTKVNEVSDSLAGTPQAIQKDALEKAVAKLEASGTSPQTVEILKGRMRVAQRRFQAVSELLPKAPPAPAASDVLDQIEEEPFVTPMAPVEAVRPPTDSVPTRLALKRAQELGLTDEEVTGIVGSGKVNKDGKTTVTPNDVTNYVNNRTKSNPPSIDFAPGEEITNPAGGALPVSETINQDRTFNDLSGQVVVIDGVRGRVRTEEGEVLLDPETGDSPIILTGNADMPARDFEGFEGLVAEQSQVSPRRAVREVSSVSEEGKVIYGDTEYDLPSEPTFANVRRSSNGEVDSMHVLVENSKGNQSWVYVTGDNVATVQTAYRVRGPESSQKFLDAVDGALQKEVLRNQASQNNKQLQSKKKRELKRQERNAPVVTNFGQSSVEVSSDYRVNNLDEPTTSPQLVQTLKATASQLGIDPDTVTSNKELFALVGPELAAGLDITNFSPQQINQATENIRKNGEPSTVLEYLLVDESISPVDRILRDKRISGLRSKNIGQYKKHGINPNMDIKTVLTSIAKSATNKLHRDTAKTLLGLGSFDLPVILTSLPNNNSIAGAFLRSSNAIVLNTSSDNGGGIVDALLHELTHAATERVLSNPKTDFEVQVRDRLLALRSEMVAKANEKFGDNMPVNLRYALEGRFSVDENLDESYATSEMVAHFFTSQTFREQLSQISPKGDRNLFQKLVDVIASLFSGKRIPSADIAELVKAMTDLTSASANLGPHPYGRTTEQVQASRVAAAQDKGLGPLNGVPNPYNRTEFEWVNHQIGALSNATISQEDVLSLIQTGRFGMLTAENPLNTVVDESANVAFNQKAVEWLKSRGYEVHEIVGRYETNGENSFLVPNLSVQDSIDFAKEFNQTSVANDKGIFYADGSYNQRTGQELNEPIKDNDDFFSAIRTSDGTVVPIRVIYDFENKIEPENEVTKVAKIPGLSESFNKVLSQDEFEVEVSNDTVYPFTVRDGKMIVNDKVLNEKVDGLSVADTEDVLEQGFALAAAHDRAIQVLGYDIHLEFENNGLDAQAVLNDIGEGNLNSSDLNDLMSLDQSKLASYLSLAFEDLGSRTNGSNERLATSQNRLGDMFRAIKDGQSDVPELANQFNEIPSSTDLEIIARTVPLKGTSQFSKAAASIIPKTVKEQVKAGTVVGTRNPVSKNATEFGTDPNSRIDLATMRQNPKVYRKNALLLVEYPIIAREFPELAAEVRGLRSKIEEKANLVQVNASNVIRYKAQAKQIIATQLGIKPSKVNSTLVEDALVDMDTVLDPKSKATLKGVNRTAFLKIQKGLKIAQDNGVVLRANAKAERDNFSKTLQRMAADDKHPIATQADQVYDSMIKSTESNLRALIDLFPSEIREIAKLWYDGANLIANRFSGEYNKSTEQSSGVLAVFSPQKDWFMNIALAERTMNIWNQFYSGEQKDFVFDQRMADQWMKRGGEPQVTGETEEGLPIYEKGKAKAVYVDGVPSYDEAGNQIFTGWASVNVEQNRAKAKATLTNNLIGKKLSDLSIEDQSKFIRMYSETYESPSFKVVTPDGNPKDFSRTDKGAEQKIAWPGYGTIQKAIRILNSDPEKQIEVISEELGKQHKVRSFYNNIVDPSSKDGHVTMDTHAVAALFWQAFSGNSFEVSQNFGTAGTSSDGKRGVNGMYAPNAEAYRAAAESFGMLPREAQSITWEAVRMLFPAKWRSQKANVDRVRGVWAKYESDKNFTIEQARSEIFKITTAKYDRDGNVVQEGKDLAEAFSDTNSLTKGLGFPSWAEVTQGVAPEGIRASRIGITPANEKEQKAFDSGVKNKRSGEVAVAAVRLFNGEINNETFAGIVEQYYPFVSKPAEKAPSLAKINQYIQPDKSVKVGTKVESGKLVEVRIDIPTYNKSSAAGDSVYAITVHEPVPDNATRVGEALSYLPAVKISNATFMTRAISGKGDARQIAIGGGKFPLATVKGNYEPITKIPADINDKNVWTEVAYNPARSSEFIDVVSKNPVLAADTAVMVGSRVFVKNPTLDSKTNYGQPRVDAEGKLTGEIDMRFSKIPSPRSFADKQVTLTHWSFSPELEEVDPTRHGKGGAGVELKRKKEYAGIYIPRTYFGYQGYSREPQIGAYRYTIQVDGNKIYDFKRDALGLYPSPEDLIAKGYARYDQRAAITLYEAAIKDAGFAGYVNTDFKAGVLFDKNKVEKIADGNSARPLTKAQPKRDLFSRAYSNGVSPSIESAYLLSMDDVMMNEVTGKFEAGNNFTKYFRASGGMDPRLFEAGQYQARAINLANARLKELIDTFKSSVKADGLTDFNDISVALGSTEPTVSKVDRSAATEVRDSSIAKANDEYSNSGDYKEYRKQVDAIRADLMNHKDKNKYLSDIKALRDSRRNPELVEGQPMTAKQIRDIKIDSAKSQYDLDIQTARAKNLKSIRQSILQAQVKLEQESPNTAKVVREMRTAIDELSVQLLNELEPDNPMRMTITQNLGVYLTRSYRIHHEEGYAQKFKEEPEFAKQREDGRKFLESEWVNNTFKSWRSDVAYEPFSDSELRILVRQEAKAKSIGQVLLNEFVAKHGSTPTTVGADQKRYDLTRFMEKGEVPEELKAVMGEITNPIEAAARTYGNLSQFIGTQKLLRSYTDIGLKNGWLVTASDVKDNPLKYEGYQQLVQTTKSRGGDPLSNYYAPKEIKEAFEAMFQAQRGPTKNDSQKFFDGLQTIASRAVGISMAVMTLGSAGFYVRNLASIPFFAMANGFVPSPSNVADAFTAIKEVHLGNLDGFGAKLIALGVVDGGMNMNMVKDLIRGLADDPEIAVQRMEGMVAKAGKLETTGAKALAIAKVPYETLVKLNESIDLLYRVSYWAHEVDVQTKANAFRTSPLSIQQIEQEAARTVRRTTQGKSNIAPIAKGFSKSGFGTLFNSFFRFTAEMIRLPIETTMVGMEEVKSGNPVLQARGAKRLLGLGATLAATAAFPAILKQMFGIGDDEEEAIRSSLADYDKDKGLFFTRGPQGVTSYNLSYVNPFSMVIDPFARSFDHAVNGRAQNIAGTIVGALAQSLLSPQIAVEAAQQLSSNKNDKGLPIWLESDSFTDKTVLGLKFLANNAYKLKTPTAIYGAFEAYTNNGNYSQEKRTAKALDILKGEIQPFKPRTTSIEDLARNSYFNLKSELDTAKRTLSGLKTSKELSSDKAEEIYNRYEDAVVSVGSKMNKYSRGFEKLGATRQQLRREATGSNGVGFSKNNFDNAVNRGTVDRFAPSPEAYTEYFKAAGGGENGTIRVNTIRNLVSQRPRYIPVK